jgi:signal transduction histidine kinase
VLRIVERHEGRIDFTTEEGKGTTFRIRLPALADA